MTIVAVAAALAACQPREDLEARLAAAWPARCEVLRQELAGRPGLAVRFAPLPAARPAPPVWILEWGGLRVPVPVREYSTLIVQRGEAAGPDVGDLVMLVDEEGSLVALMFSDGFGPIEDAFALADPSFSGGIQDSAGADLTRLLWGGPLNQAALLVRGFEVAPADLSCRGERWRQEMPDSMSLIFKGIGPGELTDAYRLRGEPPAWLTREREGGEIAWRGLFVHADRPDLATHVEYKTAAGDPAAEAGLWLAAEGLSGEAAPVWVAALQAAVRQDDRASWERLAAELPAAGFSGASVERVAALARGFDATPR